jgi:hypothetical protein
MPRPAPTSPTAHEPTRPFDLPTKKLAFSHHHRGRHTCGICLNCPIFRRGKIRNVRYSPLLLVRIRESSRPLAILLPCQVHWQHCLPVLHSLLFSRPPTARPCAMSVLAVWNSGYKPRRNKGKKHKRRALPMPNRRSQPINSVANRLCQLHRPNQKPRERVILLLAGLLLPFRLTLLLTLPATTGAYRKMIDLLWGIRSRVLCALSAILVWNSGCKRHLKVEKRHASRMFLLLLLLPWVSPRPLRIEQVL